MNIKRKDASTALIFAAAGGHLNVVQLLVQNGAEINWKNLSEYCDNL